jgi:hypothetical protein
MLLHILLRGGTVQFGNNLTQGGSTYFGIKPNGAHNYPNFNFQAGIAKSVSPWVAGDFSVISIYICSSMTFDVSNTNPNVTFIGTNGAYALNNSGTFKMGSGTFIFSCPSTSQLITGTSTNTFSNVVINNTNGVTFQIPTTITEKLILTNGNLTINTNTITFQDGDTPIVRTNGTMSWINAADLVFGTTGHTGGKVFKIPTGTFLSGASLDDFTINRTNSLALSENLIIRGTLTLTSGVLDISGVKLSFIIKDIPIYTADGTITVSTTSDMAFGTPGNTAGAAVNIPAGTFTAAAPSLRNFTICRTNGITLNQDIIINGALTMTVGNINLVGHTLTLGTAPGTPGTLSHAGAAANGWIYSGNFKRYFNTAVIADGDVAGMFPMGSSVNFRPFYVSCPSTAPTIGGTITVSHTSAVTVSNVSFDDNGSTVIRRHDSYWTCSTGGGIAVAGSPFNLRAGGTGFGLITDVSNLRLTLMGSVVGTDGSHAGTTADPQINRTGLSLADLSNNFYPASVSLSSPLPIELLSFYAVCENKEVSLYWVTASETNNDFFTVEKSSDAINFVPITTIKGAGNNNTIMEYQYKDKTPYAGVSYYRIKQTDYNGKFSYSEIREVKFLSALSDFSVFPNPVNSGEILQIIPCNNRDISYTISVYALNGQKVAEFFADGPFAFIIYDYLNKGVYVMDISAGGADIIYKIAIQ